MRRARDGITALAATSYNSAYLDISVLSDFRRHAILGAGLILRLAPRAQQASDTLRTVTLPQALEMGLRVSPALAAGHESVVAARAARLIVTGEYLTSLGVTSSAAVERPFWERIPSPTAFLFHPVCGRRTSFTGPGSRRRFQSLLAAGGEQSTDAQQCGAVGSS
ncbi:MAG: hypothetical protein M3R65_06260 [Gemmatimonadota bacterium]|nr:hypothetical protein [Gemmatimonadota bacterium]